MQPPGLSPNHLPRTLARILNCAHSRAAFLRHCPLPPTTCMPAYRYTYIVLPCGGLPLLEPLRHLAYRFAGNHQSLTFLLLLTLQ